MIVGGWKDIQNSASDSKLPAPRNHIHALIGHLNQLERQLWQQVVIAAGQREGWVVLKTANDRLQCGSNGNQQCGWTADPRLQLNHAVQSSQPLPNSFGGR